MTTPNPWLEAALAGEAAGLSMFPPKQDGSKMPDTTSWTGYHTPDAAGDIKRETPKTLRKLYANGRTGVGAFMGAVSGNTELFDFDDILTYEVFLEAADNCGLGELVARIRAGYEEETPSGARHWLYRCNELGGSTKLAQRPKRPEEIAHPNDKTKTLIETKSTGGYAVLAPSSGRVHPTGKPYQLLSGDFDTIATITPDERRALWDLARAFDQMPIKEPYQPKPASDSTPGERPGDIFNQRSTWPEVLEPHGWRFVYESAGTAYWRRPGKDRGISATTNHTGRDTLIVFSSSTDFELSPSSYDRFGAYVVLNHGGDFTAAAKDLYAKGYQAPEVEYEVIHRPKRPDSADGPPPDGDGPCTEALAELRIYIGELERRNQALSDKASILERELADTRAENADLLETHSAMMAILRNKGLKAERFTGLAVVNRIVEAQSHGETGIEREIARGADPDLLERGYVRILQGGKRGPDGSYPEGSLADEAGCSPGRVSAHLDVFQQCGTLDKKIVTRIVEMPRDPETGETRARRISECYVRLNDEPKAILRRLATLAPEKPETWGGRRQGCPDHPNAAILTISKCAECGRVLRSSETHQHIPADETLGHQDGRPREDSGRSDPTYHRVSSWLPKDRVDALDIDALRRHEQATAVFRGRAYGLEPRAPFISAVATGETLDFQDESPPEPPPPAGAACPDCEQPLVAYAGSVVCWSCNYRGCRDCGRPTTSAMRAYCGPCQLRAPVAATGD